MANAKVKLDHHGMATLLKDDGVREDLTRRMQRVAEQARATAPVVTGDYRDNIDVFQATTDRVSVRVGSTSDHAFAVEAATGNLARALDAAGGA